MNSMKKPTLKSHPKGYAECADGYWTYSSRAVRNGRAGWMFHKKVKKDEK